MTIREYFISMNSLLSYYQKELNFLKKHGRVFAERFPKIARRLGMIEGESADPHVSRLIESFALLTSRIHQRLDEDMPEVVEALIASLAPQFLRPLPSTCIVMMEPDPARSGISGKNILAPGTALFTRNTAPLPCQFQTIYPVTLLPLSIETASLHFDSDILNWKLRLQFRVWPGGAIGAEKIRLYLHGQDNAVNLLYTVLCSELQSLGLSQGDKSIALSATAISPVGFEVEDALLTRDPSIAPIHILLLDYFYFPQKFSFIDLQLPEGFTASGNESFEIQAVIRRNRLTKKLEKMADIVDASFFRLFCSPAVNLFTQRAEPLTLNDATVEHPVIPDNRYPGLISVWSIDTVTVQRKTEGRIDHWPVRSLLESHLHMDKTDNAGLRWQSTHREVHGPRGVEPTCFITFSKSQPGAASPDAEVVTITMRCSNHTLPHQLSYGHPDGDFDADAAVAALKTIALTHPTRPLNPPEKSAQHWRFLAQLSLNHQLLTGERGAQQLAEMLSLYNRDVQPGKTPLFMLIQSLECQPVTRRLVKNDPHSLARGINVLLTFRHQALNEPDYYLFCALLDRLLALYAPVNSFIRLATCIEQEAETLHQWPVRAGRLSWL